MVFFKSIDKYGDLKLDKVLFMFDNIPMIFVCKDERGRYFLCQCVDLIINYSWMITQISVPILIQMMKGEISILKAFEESGHEIILADMQENQMTYRKMSFGDISAEDLPDGEEKLENPCLKEYISKLQNEENLRKEILKARVKVREKNKAYAQINLNYDNVSIGYNSAFANICTFIEPKRKSKRILQGSVFKNNEVVGKNKFFGTLVSKWNQGTFTSSYGLGQSEGIKQVMLKTIGR